MIIIMKIYIENYLPEHLNICKIEHLYKKTEHTKIIYSSEGIFSIEKNKIYKLFPSDTPIIKIPNYYKHYKLFCDSSSFTKEEVYSQLPFKHVLIESTLKYYCLGNEERKSAGLYLVVSENNETDSINDFYFLSSESLDNRLVQEELNVFMDILFN